jgi:chorismate mutase/prephenate dehydratase
MAAKRGRSKPATRRKATKAAVAAPLLKPALEQIRARIDDIDAQLHELINQRAQLAKQVGISKHAAGHTVDFYRP